MIDFLQIISEATSLSPEVAIIIFTLVSSIVFYAKDFRIGLLSSFILTALAYVLLYLLDLNTELAILILLILVVLLALSIYLTASRSENPLLIR